MKRVYATYIDHQEVIQYPINFLASELDGLLVFCSDEQNKNYLATQGIEAQAVGVSINIPTDIAIAQNKCVDVIFTEHDPDFIVWVQADIYITKEGHEIIDEFCISSNLDQTCALSLLHLRLFHIFGHTHFGVNVIGKNAWERKKFTNDGAYLGGAGADFCERNHKDSTIDIGYLSIDQYRNHVRQHAKTWSSDAVSLDLPDNEFVRQIIKMNKLTELIKEDSIHYELVKKMGLETEYKKVKSLC